LKNKDIVKKQEKVLRSTIEIETQYEKETYFEIINWGHSPWPQYLLNWMSNTLILAFGSR
jgi:hypothetical protein